MLFQSIFSLSADSQSRGVTRRFVDVSARRRNKWFAYAEITLELRNFYFSASSAKCNYRGVTFRLSEPEVCCDEPARYTLRASIHTLRYWLYFESVCKHGAM